MAILIFLGGMAVGIVLCAAAAYRWMGADP